MEIATWKILSIISPKIIIIYKTISQHHNFSPSIFSVDNFAMTHNCCEYVVIGGVLIVNGPVAMSFLFVWFWLSFGNKDFPSNSTVLVIGGPVIPTNIPKPKQAKNARKTITNSLLCIVYSRIWTDLEQQRANIISKRIYKRMVLVPFASVMVISRSDVFIEFAENIAKLW